MHNLRSNYCDECMRATLESRTPKSEADFILEQIRRSHNLVTQTLGQVLRTAIASGLAGQVGNLLRCVGRETAEIIINEVPPSRSTALMRAEALSDSSYNKRAIITMLRT